ncbi:YdgA family protein [Erwiniaceae bacterium BAC15a-03b]|uniref:YdgA family protein n=1 Tax=Winslowiella arboricola TaxID=2978220 RepID=A0A9J6PY58_9GAMM|nr:YdgA family protein [Winslowiella arboricola]MCU5772403.1 YdgA family protein [Winslowiella arboricola]MCU5779804.1 YdgA family protein [Winslowiella arboricola]
MKKTKIAVSVVVALGIIWTGGAWFTGKQLESHMDTLVQNANAQLNNIAPDSRLKVSYQDYQRGLFSSHAKLVVQASSQTEDNALLKPGQSIVLNETIDHGPFPFAQLKKFNLIPGMASVHTELENTEAVKGLFEVTKGVSVVQADTRIGYSGATSSAITLLPLDYQNATSGQRFAWNGGTLNVDADAQGDKVSFDGNIDSIAVTSKNQMDMPVMFTLNGLKAKANTHLSPQGVRVGDQGIDLKKLTASVNGQEAVTLEGLEVNASFDSDDKTVSGQVDYTLDNLKMQNQSFGQGKLALKLSQFDGAALKTFSENYKTQMQALLNQPGIAEDPLRYQQGMNQILVANLPTLLKGDPIVTIAPLSWKNDKGESSFNLAVNFKDPATATGEAQNINQAADRVLKSLDGKLVISMDMATELMTHVAMAEGHPQDQAVKLAEQQVKGLAAMGQMFKLTTQQDNNIVTSLQYATGQVTMNGEKMPLDQFLSRYMLGGMSAQPQALPAE